MPCSAANASAPSPISSTCGDFSITARASLMGFFTRLTPATAPAARLLPSMIAASSSLVPAFVNTAPLPALNSGESSMTTIAATPPSRLAPPASSTAYPAGSACSSAARYSASSSGVRSPRRIVPAPPWIAMAIFPSAPVPGSSSAGSSCGAAPHALTIAAAAVIAARVRIGPRDMAAPRVRVIADWIRWIPKPRRVPRPWEARGEGAARCVRRVPSVQRAVAADSPSRCVEAPELEVQAGRERHPEQVGDEQQRGEATVTPEEQHGDRDGAPERQDLQQGEADAVAAEEEPGPGGVEGELDEERAERPGGAGEPAAFPDEPRRDRHEAVQHGPDDAEHPAGRRERGLGELVVP